MQTRGSESTELKFNKLTIYSLKLNPIQKPKSTHDKKLWLRGLFVFRSLQNADGTEPRGQARGAAPLGRTLGHDASPVRIFRFFESSLFPLTFRTETVETVSLVSHACLHFRCCVQSTFETTFGTRAELGGSGWRRRTKKPRAQRLMISAAWRHGQVTDRSRTGHGQVTDSQFVWSLSRSRFPLLALHPLKTSSEHPPPDGSLPSHLEPLAAVAGSFSLAMALPAACARPLACHKCSESLGPMWTQMK